MKTIAVVIAMVMMLQIPCGTPTSNVVETVEIPTQSGATAPVVEKIELDEERITFRVTAYCSCYKCCGKWALNRPIDENGHEIVRGASGERLIANYSCASPLPFGTKIEVDGLGTFEVHDRTAQWVVDKYGENLIDVYVDNHEDIAKIGRQFLEGVIVND